MNYYNEIDPKAAAWLRELINRDFIAPGEVDERSIEDVVPGDLKGFTQCHFFAGIGGWSYALRLAGWPDDQPVWTGSCPCQPFSSAGKGAGFDDERHLWPSWFHLIKQCKPAAIFGEQAASKRTDAWVDLVHADLESMGYAFGCVAFPAAGVGAPHIRDRNYWMAHADGWDASPERKQCSGEQRQLEENSIFIGLADADSERYKGSTIWPESTGESKFKFGSDAGGMAYSSSSGSQEQRGRRLEPEGFTSHGSTLQLAQSCGRFEYGINRPGAVNGHWSDADWLRCTDGSWRPVEPGTFPLANGLPARLVRLRGYGNAINIQAAKAFIEASGLVK